MKTKPWLQLIEPGLCRKWRKRVIRKPDTWIKRDCVFLQELKRLTGSHSYIENLFFLSPFSIYLLAVTSQAVGGTTETLCMTVNPRRPVTLDVTLEYNQNSVRLLSQLLLIGEFYRCVPFKVRLLMTSSWRHLKVKIICNEHCWM